MVTLELEVTNKLGLHARPASKLVKLVSTSASSVYLVKNGKRVNAKSILGVMLLEVTSGSTVSVEIEGVDEAAVAAGIAELFQNRFGED